MKSQTNLNVVKYAMMAEKHDTGGYNPDLI
jgi:hypothetical protein